MTYSVIIPTHNRHQLLTRALKSIAGQTKQPDQLVIVDDCSVPPISVGYEQYSFRLKLVRLEKRVGSAEARNIGVENADCDVLIFLDSDDELMPAAIEEYACCYRAGETSAAFFSAIHVMSTGEKHTGHGPCFQDQWFSMAYRTFIPTLSCFSIKKFAFMSIGGFDNTLRIIHDLEFYLRALVAYRFTECHKVLCIKYDQRDSVTSNTRQWADELSRLPMVLRRNMSTSMGIKRHIILFAGIVRRVAEVIKWRNTVTCGSFITKAICSSIRAYSGYK